MDWTSIYQSRITTAEEAVRIIKSGMRIFLTGNVSVPQKSLAALVDYAPNLENVEICQALTIGPADYVKPRNGRTSAGQYAVYQRKCPQGSAGRARRFYAGVALRIPAAFQAWNPSAGCRRSSTFLRPMSMAFVVWVWKWA